MMNDIQKMKENMVEGDEDDDEEGLEDDKDDEQNLNKQDTS